jgi:RelA/SpoT family (p)ppGpp synthetase
MRTPAIFRRARSSRSTRRAQSATADATGDQTIRQTTPSSSDLQRDLLARFTTTPLLDSFTRLLDLCARYLAPQDLDLIRATYVLGYEAHSGAFRKSGEPFIEHPIAVAAILAGLAVDANGIAAALLHDTAEDTDISLETLRATFGETISEIVDGVTKFGAVEAPKQGDARAPGASSSSLSVQERKARANAETVHKLFLTMMRDPRVVLLKLADRLHNMRTLASMSDRQREVKSREALEIYAPLAGRIGLYGVKGELEDLAFSYLYPAEFARVSRMLRDEEARRAKWARRMCDRMRRELAASGVPAAVNWRLKRPFRAWVEAREVGTDVLMLNDLIAFRVLVTTIPDCYQALGYIHRLWLPYERIRDYISNAKANGYRSLHTAVFALDGRLAQVHIRTHQMHRAALHGVATVWLERAAIGAHDPTGQAPRIREEQPLWVQQLASWEHDLKLSALDFVDAIRDEMFETQVFVFTPHGESRELPAGATALDLAYQIHTNIGDHAVGARIQTTSPGGALLGRELPIDYVLQTGDVVEILTDPNVYPQPDWRELAVTRYAREKIARALRLRARQELGGSTPRREESEAVARATAHKDAHAEPLTHPDGEQAITRLASCCYPCPGDEILGLAERGAVVSIHRACCLRLRAMLERRRERGEPWAEPLRVTWDRIEPGPYRLRLAIWGQDHPGLMYEVSSSVAELGLSVIHAVATANQDRYKAAISLTLEMPLDVRRDTVLRKLRAVPGVTHVERDTRKGCD